MMQFQNYTMRVRNKKLHFTALIQPPWHCRKLQVFGKMFRSCLESKIYQFVPDQYGSLVEVVILLDGAPR